MQPQDFSTHTPVCGLSNFLKVKKASQKHQCDIRDLGRPPEKCHTGGEGDESAIHTEQSSISGEGRQLVDGLIFWAIVVFYKIWCNEN